jgi:hypothetical protein
MKSHEETLRLLAGIHESKAQRMGFSNSEHAASCLAGADALRREVALRLVLKCAERACDADNMDAAVDYVREAIRQIAPTEPTR